MDRSVTSQRTERLQTFEDDKLQLSDGWRGWRVKAESEAKGDGRLTRSLHGADSLVDSLSENAARRLSRRRFLGKGVKGAAVVMSAVFAGSFAGIRRAFAFGCGCNGLSCGPPLPTGQAGCKSGCTVCKSASGCGYCVYSIGYWVCCFDCCGRYGHGYYLCYDCKCPGCASACTQQSGCICNNCTSPADMREEFGSTARRTQHAAAALN